MGTSTQDRLRVGPPESGRFLRGGQAHPRDHATRRRRMATRTFPRQGLAEATARKRAGVAQADPPRTALKRRILTENPFASLEVYSRIGSTMPACSSYPARLPTKIIARAGPYAEWRLIISLARYGGLRMPSEMLALRWPMSPKTGSSYTPPKTRRHEGKGNGWFPCSPSSRSPYVKSSSKPRSAANSSSPDTVGGTVIYGTSLRGSSSGPGSTAWPQTLPEHAVQVGRRNLLRALPLHVVTAWIGKQPACGPRSTICKSATRISNGRPSRPRKLPMCSTMP